MAKNDNIPSAGNAGETGVGNVPGTYRDPLSGVRETALNEPQADALVRLGWIKTDKDDEVKGFVQLAELDQPNGSTSAEGREATDAAKKDEK